MIKRLIKRLTHKHTWTKTYDGIMADSQYACVECGKRKQIFVINEGAWRVKRVAKGDEFID